MYLETIGAELASQERVDKINVPNHVDKEQELGEVEARRPDGVGVQRAHQVAGERAQLARPLVAAVLQLREKDGLRPALEVAQQARYLRGFVCTEFFLFIKDSNKFYCLKKGKFFFYNSSILHLYK